MTNEELDRARAEEAAKRIKNLGTYGGSLPVYSISAITEAARLAREGWMPPEPVDPDLAEAEAIWFEGKSSFDIALAGIKRGRALAAAEAKPGMVWVKHDRSNHCPVNPDNYVWIKRHAPFFGQTAILMAGAVGWPKITHYAIITPPEDAA